MSDHASEGQARAVDHLQDLYSVVVAIALGLAVERVVVGPSSSLTSAARHSLFVAGSLPLAFALVATVLPFYYGALRHLDTEYRSASRTRTKPYALLVDFFGLFLESCAFLALGAAVDATRTFGWTLLVLLGIDVVWAATALFWLTKRSDEDATADVVHADRSAEEGWLWVNIVFGVLLAGLLITTRHWTISAETLRWPILALAVTRTAVDIPVGWRLYVAS